MQGTISFDGTLSGGITGGGGGGSEVTITPTLQSGTKIADYSIDQEAGSLYAPTPEELPDTIVTKALRKYNDTSQTKIMTVTTYDKENDQEVSQDIYAPSPVDCWYTPGLEQDYQIGQFTYGDVTQDVYIPDFQRPLTAGANITIDQDNVISASGGSSWNYSTSEVNTGQKWIDGKDIYCRVFDLPDKVLNDNTWNNNVLGTSNIHIIRFDGFIGFQGYDITLPLNYYRNNNEFITTILTAGYNDINIRPNLNAGITVKGLNCTIFYTKNS